MPTKRSTATDYRGAGLDLDWRPFDERSVDRLIDVTRWPAPPLDRGEVARESVERSAQRVGNPMEVCLRRRSRTDG